jgi:hypothetical protein
MADVSITPARPASARAAVATDGVSYLDWSAIIAGALLATAISLVLFAFGGALGLGMVSPEEGSVPGRWLAIAAGLYFVWVVVSANVAGGYLAGRMRRRTGDATADESDTRDGANGLTVWAVATLIGAMLATSGVSTVTRSAGAAVSTAAQAAGSAAGGAAGALGGELDYFAGLVQRGEGTALGSPEVRSEITTILARSVRQGEVSQADRDYMVNLVAEASGTPPDQVSARVDEALGQFEEARQAAIDAAEAARIAGIVIGFAIAATLFAAAAAAYMAAVTGGNHRDENLAFRTIR